LQQELLVLKEEECLLLKQQLLLPEKLLVLQELQLKQVLRARLAVSTLSAALAARACKQDSCCMTLKRCPCLNP